MVIARRVGQVAIALVMLATVSAGAWMWHSGWRAYVVHTGSMSPTYKPGSLVIDRPGGGALQAGQVITFRHSSVATDVVTHRIVNVTSTGIHTKGDANRTADVWNIRPDQVRGTVAAGIPFAGYAVVYLKQPAGIASVITAVLALIFLWGLFFPAEPPAAKVSLTKAPLEPEPKRGDARLRRLRPLRRRVAAVPGALAIAALLALNIVGGTAAAVQHHDGGSQPRAEGR